MLYTLHIIANLCYCLPRSLLEKVVRRKFSPREAFPGQKGQNHHPNFAPFLLILLWPHPLLWHGSERLLNCICHKSLTIQKRKRLTPIPIVSVPASAAQRFAVVQTPCAVAPGLTFGLASVGLNGVWIPTS